MEKVVVKTVRFSEFLHEIAIAFRFQIVGGLGHLVPKSAVEEMDQLIVGLLLRLKLDCLHLGKSLLCKVLAVDLVDDWIVFHKGQSCLDGGFTYRFHLWLKFN